MSKVNNWIVKAADQVERFINQRNKKNTQISCSSGISPSGVIHLGNLREIFSAHLVAEELLRRGKEVEHLHFWDDYDRLRKIPANVPESFRQYMGQPLSGVPDPFGVEDSYATHFKKEFEDKLEILGIQPTCISQAEVYQTKRYLQPIKDALENRLSIFDILLKYIREEKQEEVSKTRDSYYPFKVYCESCNTDNTAIDNYEKADATITYKCDNCGHKGSYSLNDKISGKLVWKVDWPMRWKDYEIDFEPGGVDHSTPGSSYTIGKELVKRIMDGAPPQYIGYAFVGFAGGASKISSSTGSMATPENALKVLEPAILRWLYIRANSRQSFTINFDKQIVQLYDEWDRLVDKSEKGTLSDKEKFILDNCIKTSVKDIAYSKVRVPFKLLCSAIEMTSGKLSEIVRVVSEHTDLKFTEANFMEQVGLRYKLAKNWIDFFQEESEKLKIKENFDPAIYDAQDENIQRGLSLLVDLLEENWTLAQLSKLVYRVPKQLLGLSFDTKPTPELKVLQRQFFIAIYSLILGDETGPRLPTLFISLGREKISNLLGLEYKGRRAYEQQE